MINQYYTSMLSEKDVIFEIFQYSQEKAKLVGAENIYDFSLGNPSVPAPEIVNDTITKNLQQLDPLSLHGYSPGMGIPETRAAIAADLNEKYGCQYKPQNIFMAIGAAGALAHAFRAVNNPGDTVLTFAPCFSEYKPYTAGASLNLSIVPADIDSFQINFDAFEEMLTPAVTSVLINSPNNPSGIVYSTETIERLAAILNAKSEEFGHPIYLITDEPYREIVFGGTVVPYVPKYYKNTLVCYSWSKSLSLPGERMGYIVVPNEMDEHELVYAAIAGAGRSLGYVNAPGLFQRVCAMCADMTADTSVYETNKNILMQGLRDLGFHVVEPGGTFYMFPRTLEEDDVAFCERAKEYNLLIVPGVGFGCPGHTRISYCVQTEMVKRSLDAFEKLAKSYR